MKRMTRNAVFAFCLMIFFPITASAYIGPGTGLSGLGSLLGLIATVFVAIFGFIWYPFKRLYRKLKSLRGAPSLDSSRKEKQ